MVTFFCNSCGEYLKKKQAELHVSYCASVLSCGDCKGEFSGFNQVKNHTVCVGQVAHKKTTGSFPVKKEVEKIEIKEKKIEKASIQQLKLIQAKKWVGFKKTILVLVSENVNQSISKDVLKNRVSFVFDALEVGHQRDFDELFELKIKKVKEISIKLGEIKLKN